MDTFRTLALTFFGSGLIPFSRGTWGSLATAAVLWGGFALLHPVHPVAAFALAPVIAVLATAGCVAWGRFAEERWQKKDPGQVVLDETAGQAVALCGWNLLAPGAPWLILVAVVAFRVFDIAKPPPCHRLQHLPGGPGIVADDVVAGIYAWIVTLGFAFLAGFLGS